MNDRSAAHYSALPRRPAGGYGASGRSRRRRLRKLVSALCWTLGAVTGVIVAEAVRQAVGGQAAPGLVSALVVISGLAAAGFVAVVLNVAGWLGEWYYETHAPRGGPANPA